jgi:uncharacterized protein (TIGR02453 family)
MPPFKLNRIEVTQRVTQMAGNAKNLLHFKGFSHGLFSFLDDLAENNNKVWFDQHRDRYQAEVLVPVKAFVADIGPTLRILNPELETDPRVGKTISRINNDIRFHKMRPPYRPFVYVTFLRRGGKWTSDALLYIGLSSHGISVGFYPGGYREARTGPVQQGIKNNLRLFQKYLKERRIPDRYFELTGGESEPTTKWPLPKAPRRWANFDGFNVGDSFSASDSILARRSFLDRAQEILVDLYPLWLFAGSDELKKDLDLYRVNCETLARPISKAAD